MKNQEYHKFNHLCILTQSLHFALSHNFHHSKLLRKLTQDPAPLSVPVFAQRFCVPHPQGVIFALISQNGQKIFPPCTFFSPVFTIFKKHFQRCTFYIKCICIDYCTILIIFISFNNSNGIVFITSPQVIREFAKIVILCCFFVFFTVTIDIVIFIFAIK